MVPTSNPPDLPVPNIQIRFRGLLVFHAESGQIRVHHDAPQHVLRVAIETIPPSGSGIPSDRTYLPDSAGDYDIVFDVQNPAAGYRGIYKYPPAGSTAYPEYDYDRLLRFRSLSSGHAGATEDANVLSSKVVLNYGYFFSAENGDVVKAFQSDDCNGDRIRVSFVVAVNIYLTSGGKAVLQYHGGSKDLVADGTTYNIEITNFPPEGMFGMSPHFRYYYRAFSGVPMSEQYDICHPHRLPLVTFEHPCIPVDGA